jgi:hypothetical protein
MKDANPGITFREKMAGGFALGETDPGAGQKKGKSEGDSLSMNSTITIHDLEQFKADPNHAGDITAHISFASFGDKILTKCGLFYLFSPTSDLKHKLMVYEFGFEHEGKDYYLAGKKEIRNDPGFDMWKDTTTLFTQLHEGVDKIGPVVGAGILRINLTALVRLVLTMRAINAGSIWEKVGALLNFGRFFIGSLWDVYATPC